MSFSDVGPQGGCVLGELLGRDGPLEALQLAGNRLGAEGALCLFSGLESNKHLHFLGLAGNEIGHFDAPVPSIVEVLSLLNNKSATGGGSGSHDFASDPLYFSQAICESLRLNSRLLSIDLRDNSIAVGYREAIAHAILHHHHSIYAVHLKGACYCQHENEDSPTTSNTIAGTVMLD